MLEGGHVDLGGQQLIELLGEGRHAVAQHAGVEGHVDARHGDERALAHTVGGLGEGGEAALGSGHRVLLAGDVVVDNLQKLPGGMCHRGDVIDDVTRCHTDHVRAQRTHAVVGVALGIARHERTHRGAARVDDVDHGLEVENPAE